MGRNSKPKISQNRRRKPVPIKVAGFSVVLWKVGKRDNWICWICRQEVFTYQSDGIGLATKDHLIPQALGGPQGMWNLRISHRGCNNNRPNEVPPSRAELLRYVDSYSLPIMLERFHRAYGYPFSAHERDEPTDA